MTDRRHALIAAASLPALAAAGCASPRATASHDELQAQVRAAETAFADTMARRDLAGFGSFLADDAVFVNGGKPLRGKAAIVVHWTRFYAPGPAPFSWKPELAEVSGEGRLGYTEGPVMDPSGKVFAKFFTTWQLGSDGRWRVIFDNGYTVCKA